jgi:phosphohistidine phosphatase
VIPQAACVPFRPSGNGYEVLLITNRKGKWGLPKGIVDPGETPQQTAAKEAFEEAGLIGAVEEPVIAAFAYAKWGETLDVKVYLMQVAETQPGFSESEFRRREWLVPEVALRRIRSRMYDALAKAVEALDARFGATTPRPPRVGSED